MHFLVLIEHDAIQNKPVFSAKLIKIWAEHSGVTYSVTSSLCCTHTNWLHICSQHARKHCVKLSTALATARVSLRTQFGQQQQAIRSCKPRKIRKSSSHFLFTCAEQLISVQCALLSRNSILNTDIILEAVCFKLWPIGAEMAPISSFPAKLILWWLAGHVGCRAQFQKEDLAKQHRNK